MRTDCMVGVAGGGGGGGAGGGAGGGRDDRVDSCERADEMRMA